MTDSVVHIAVLGSVRVSRDDKPVAIGGPKPQLLVARLALNAPRPVSTDELIDVMWGESPPVTARKMLQKYVWNLRSIIGGDLLVTEGDGYALTLDPSQVDALRFGQLLEEATGARHEGNNVRAWEILAEALALWRGRPMTGLDDAPFISDEVHRLEEMRLAASEEQIQVGLELGKQDLLLPRIQELASRHPFRERLWGALMLALYRSGRHAEALAAFAQLRRTLGEELGVEPSPELVELENKILLHDPALRFRAPSVESNLPAQLTSFVGRTKELTDVSDLLAVSRLVNLVGPAGSGKTRLAVEVAKHGADGFPDGVWFTDLAPTTSPDGVADTVATVFGVKGQPERPAEAVLVEYLSDRELLLVLDNCEHLVEGVVPLVARLLRAHERLTILATSREPLGMAGENTYEVSPLSFPTDDHAPDIAMFDAVRLFVDRAGAADPGFVLDAANMSAVAQICRRLDGLPLALELAAARVHSLPPEQLSRHLGERFDLLTATRGATVPHHQTLRAAIDWSYDVLSSQGQTLLGRLSVFRGGFDLEAVEDICGDAPLERGRTLPILSDLVDKSLVVIEQPADRRTRYSLLETLRAYSHERLDPAEADQVREAHAEYFCGFAEQAVRQLRGPRQQVWLHRLELNSDNLRAALRWSFSQHPETAIRLAAALADYWDSVGSRAEGQEWLRQAVELSDSTTPELAIAARLAAGQLFISTKVSHSVRFATDALERARRIGDATSEAKALQVLTMAGSLGEDYADTEALGLQALDIFERLGDTWETALCLERLGQPFYAEPERSLRYFERSLDLYREAGDRRRQAVVLQKLAERTAVTSGNLDAAREWVEESLAICEEVGSPQDGAHALLEYGKILRRQGHITQAEEVLEDALERLQKAGDLRCTVRTLTALGIARIEGDEPTRAREALVQSLELGRTLDEEQYSRVALAGIARLLVSSGRMREAATLYGYAEKLGREQRIPVTTPSMVKRAKVTESLRSSMGQTEFDRSWQEGEAMNLDEAIAVAFSSHVG